eukprot:CAMPEP_0119565530 /NCGR_PEP_ID=MMETSP1352-20130426/30384_1 /TAXON_ID=265584 /ORGANISM="Stauroneis constricta, Strain CCMP1120" /LENGTH=610 /DNA_ID=CAMNT_0007614465 /DNA_START=32 /DNA_END=1867 /DNA_ORIENTATION=-
MSPNQDVDTSAALSEPLLSSDANDGNSNNARTATSSSSSQPAAANSTGNDGNSSDLQKDFVFPSWMCCGAQKKMNHNVLLNLLLCVVYGVSGSLWNGTANAAYLKKLGHDRNGPLGDIEAVSGLASLITALPVGYLADRFGRSRIIAIGGWLVFVTTIVQAALLAWIGTEEDDADEDQQYGFGMSASELSKRSTALWIYGLVMAFWGVSDGVVNGPAQALYADSTEEGERSTYYTYLFACYIGASSVGPIVSIVLFQTLGDTWDLYHLRMVLYVGLGIGLLNFPLMMAFDDKKSLDEGGDAAAEPESGAATATTATAATATTNAECQQDACGEQQDAATVTTTTASATTTEAEATTNENAATEAPVSEATATLRRRQKWIPYIIFIQALILAIGSGMTVKFFPLFFKDEVGMSPSQVQIIYVCVPLVMIFSSSMCSALAKIIGRVQATVVFSLCGVSCLYSMVFFKSYLDSHPFLLVPIYVIRTSLMNGSYPLQESILMDFVPKEERARWKSLDSVAAFGWCGSAAFGGWLSDKYDYTYTFLITAIVQTAGILVFSTLMPLVPIKEGSRDHDDGGENENGQAASDSNGNAPTNADQESLSTPLLSSDCNE